MRQRKGDTQEFRIFLCRNSISKVYGFVQCYNNAVHDSINQHSTNYIPHLQMFSDNCFNNWEGHWKNCITSTLIYQISQLYI